MRDCAGCGVRKLVWGVRVWESEGGWVWVGTGLAVFEGMRFRVIESRVTA